MATFGPKMFIVHCKIRHWILYTSHECMHIVMHVRIGFVTSDKIQCVHTLDFVTSDKSQCVYALDFGTSDKIQCLYVLDFITIYRIQ